MNGINENELYYFEVNNGREKVKFYAQSMDEIKKRIFELTNKKISTLDIEKILIDSKENCTPILTQVRKHG